MPRTRYSREDDTTEGGQIRKPKSVRKEIRETRLLLAKEDIPETVKLTKERVLKSLRKELNEYNKRSRKSANKHHRVKIVERAQIFKQLKKKVKKYSKLKEDGDRTQILHEVSQLRKELNYVDNFPPDEKYIALRLSTDTTTSHALGRKEELFEHIVEMVERGELPDSSEKIPGLANILSVQSQEPSEASVKPCLESETVRSKEDHSRSSSAEHSVSQKKMEESVQVEPRE